MPRGGKRPGAGRKAGSPNRATAAVRAEIAASGEEPRDYMLRVMRDERAEPARRDAMAKAVAPYIHPRLVALEHSGQLRVLAASELSDDELAAIASSGSDGAIAAPRDPQLTY